MAAGPGHRRGARVLGRTVTDIGDKKPRATPGLQVLGERKPRSVFGNDRGAAPVEAVIDPALHHVETVTVAYERSAKDATGFNATDPNGFTEIEFDVVVLDLRRPTRREAPFDAGPDDPTEALATGKGRVKKGPIRQKADAGRTGFGEGSAALHIEKPIICRIAQTIAARQPKPQLARVVLRICTSPTVRR
jgi:hypothetical protein